MINKILITGGAGYIGSHILVELLFAGYQCVVIDNLCNSSYEAVERVKIITEKNLDFELGDVRDPNFLKRIFSKYEFEAVIHLSGLKSVGESILQPLIYYDNNVNATHSLLKVMQEYGVFSLIFSSSATVYGMPDSVPISENSPARLPSSPYGRSKLIIEEMLADICVSDPRWSVGIMRYFNPVGAHESGLIGENPSSKPGNLLPYILRVAAGQIDELQVFGNDYPTPDGSGIRDYIHVVDLAKGHLSALKGLDYKSGTNVWNLGTGRGYSVLELIRVFEKENEQSVPHRVVPRRDGDVAISLADPTKAFNELGWSAQRDLAAMMRDSWRWQTKNPSGYS